MGNCQCQAAEVATVLIQHPGGGRTERAYWALSAAAVMEANPGHYVAAVITTTAPQPAAGDGEAASSAAAAPVKHLKLLRPDDTLLLGRVYRLVSFEEVLREFASKRQVKLSRVTVRAKDEAEDVKPASKHRRRRPRASAGGGGGGERKESSEWSLAKVMPQTAEELEPDAGPSTGPSAKHADTPSDADLDAELEALLPHEALLGRRAARQWRPALQSIAEG
ncbi:unnamed protein product [Miscanthus lutarioriparius]|uniref:Uncharacterized protein n=1 Tax=Miscanthus lutarioriparius TaxID=422564 RepID=A0A811MQV1_9POAL|nr:unnamed protein product [Miscanthus lutarioriparius]